LNPNLQLAVARHELERDARHRQPETARASDIGVAAGRDHSALGRAQQRHPLDALADCVERKLVECVEDLLNQARAGKLQDSNATEETFPQRTVATEPRHQFLITFRHIRIENRRNLPQIADGLLDLTRQWPAIVDVKCPAAEQCGAEAASTAEDMAPGQPVDQHRGLPGKRRITRQQHFCGTA
jgi:hypothetical protein